MGVESRKINKGEDNEVRFAFKPSLPSFHGWGQVSLSQPVSSSEIITSQSYFKDLIMKIYIKHLAQCLCTVNTQLL